MIHVWRIELDAPPALSPTPGEAARAARFATEELARRYLAAHTALRAVLASYTSAPLLFATGEKGKPYLAQAPDLHFNLSHSRSRALVAISQDAEVGVDIEFIRPMRSAASIVDRFFPPGDPQPADEVEFFRRWTCIEALLKARGVGIYGAGAPLEPGWSVAEVDAGTGFAGAIAIAGTMPAIQIRDFGANQ